MSPGRFIRDNPIAVCLLAVAATSAIFLAFPGIDPWFSELFYRSRGGFWLRRSDVLGLFRATNDILIAVIVAALVASVVIRIARPDRQSLVPPAVTLFLVSTLVLGPLLLVNVLLKEHWGRPRPVQVDLFGGDAPYVEVWRITDWCAGNCSFVSGEASSAIWLVAVALVLPQAVRRPAVVVAALYALLLSLNRIAFGGHFLSDVLISFGLTLLLIAVCYRVIFIVPPRWLRNEALEAGLGRLGWALRGGRGRPDPA